MVIGEFASRFPHHSDIGIVETPARPNSVQKNANFDARSRPLAKSIAKLTAYVIGLKNVGRKVNRLPGGTNRFQHCGKVLVAVSQKIDFVPVERDRIGEGQGRPEKFRIADREGMFEPILESVPPNDEEAEDQDDGQNSEAEDDPLGEAKPPPAVVKPM